MSNVNIKRAVENIRSGTNVYTPVVEVVVNAIQAIERLDRHDGVVEIAIERAGQLNAEPHALPEIVGFAISDNGIGFTNENREAFDTLYTDQKMQEGGKGFGRFTCLRYFDDVLITSTFVENGMPMRRSFKMGKETEIIVDESVSHMSSAEPAGTGSTVELLRLKRPFPDKEITTVARTLVEKLLPYFVSEDRECPKIVLTDNEGAIEPLVLNNYLSDSALSLIREAVDVRGDFELESTSGPKRFTARVFKVYSPKNQRSKISLVAHRREVTATSLHNYIPEFIEEFCDRQVSSNADRNFIVKVYVSGSYLDEHVLLERSSFEFQYEADLLFGISQRDIESAASDVAVNVVQQDVKERREKKSTQVQTYVYENAPWYREALGRLDIADMPYNPTVEQMETQLHHQVYREEVRVKGDVRKLLESKHPEELRERAAEIVRRISDSSKNELAHYVALRRSVLDIFERSLALNPDGSYSSENIVHDIIFPRKADVDSTPFDLHNLWIVDERLNFTEYLSSDLPIDASRADRPDLLAYDRRIGFRGDNEPTNPVIIFEFKRPQRDDFCNPSSKEDPIQQIVRYVSQIKGGKFRTPQGREILVSDNTPFFGYLICDLNIKVKEWAEIEKDFKPMPDRLGYFRWHENLNLYLEILGWDKLLKDASMRNRVFFQKLGIV